MQPLLAFLLPPDIKMVTAYASAVVVLEGCKNCKLKVHIP